ncbi:MAG: IS6 family transposase [Nitrospira sp.]|nr:IS6 family transposase [Nitrospira sp.]
MTTKKISYAVWLYHRFCLSFREVEELLAERGIIVTYESVRRWCLKFGPAYARRLKKRQGQLGDAWHLDEAVITIQGEQQYLWRAVDQDGDTEGTHPLRGHAPLDTPALKYPAHRGAKSYSARPATAGMHR